MKNLSNWLLVITQVGIITVMCFQCNAIKKQVDLIKEEIDLKKCQKLSERYSHIYRSYVEDLEKLESSKFSNLNKDKVKEEMTRIAKNTIRRFSFESDNPYLVFKALESLLSHKYPENKKDHILAKPEHVPQLNEIIKVLKEQNGKWPDKEDYKSWNREQECF